MNATLQAEFQTLGDEVRATAIPNDCKHTAVWCIGQLPPLYTKFTQTNESRYGDEITKLVQAVMTELARGEGNCPEARKLATTVADRLQKLHEQLGLPRLTLRTPAPPATPKSRKKKTVAP
jgi:hypothetical protein